MEIISTSMRRFSEKCDQTLIILAGLLFFSKDFIGVGVQRGIGRIRNLSEPCEIILGWGSKIKGKYKKLSIYSKIVSKWLFREIGRVSKIIKI